jgi:hypothetical protein
MGLWNALFGKPPKTEKKEWYRDAYKPLPKYVPVRQRDCVAEKDREWTLSDIRMSLAEGAGIAYTVLDRYAGNDEFGAVETYIVQYGCERSVRPGFDGDETVPNEIVEQWMPKRRGRVPQMCNHNHTMV